MKPIAHIYNDFPEKFGIPRQPGLVEGLTGRIVFEKEYRVAEAFRGLGDYSHIWLLWDFSEFHSEGWSPTVRPPHLGGNRRMGVFATRSPNRPNSIGLSVVRLLKVDLETADGPVLIVGGADLMNGTPIFDIKPYLPYVESIPEARGGFTDQDERRPLQVVFSETAQQQTAIREATQEASEESLENIAETPHAVYMQQGRGFPLDKLEALTGVLAQDPRPHYQDDPDRIYGMSFAGYTVKFQVTGEVLTVLSLQPDE